MCFEILTTSTGFYVSRLVEPKTKTEGWNPVEIGRVAERVNTTRVHQVAEVTTPSIAWQPSRTLPNLPLILGCREFLMYLL